MNRARRRQAAAVLLGLSLAGLGGWWTWNQRVRSADAAALAAARAAEAASAAPTLLSPEQIAEAAARANPLPITGWEADSADGQACEQDSAAGGEPVGPHASTARAPPELVFRVITALTTAAEPEARALGAWWWSIDAGRQATAQFAAATAACGDRAGCERRAFGHYLLARSQAREPGATALATLASRSTNPVVYAMAIEACRAENLWVGPGTAAAACEPITLERWAELDADNAVPWMFLASQALERRDPAGVAQALHRASLARHNLAQGPDLLRVAQPALATLAEPDRMSASLQLVTMQAQWTPPDPGVVLNHCDADALGSPDIRTTCEGLARLWMERSAGLSERGLGIRLAERLGWPAELVAGLRAEQTALHAGLDAARRVDTRVSPCAAGRQSLHQATLTSMLGETGLARVMIARSGQTPEAYVRQQAAQQSLLVGR